MKDPQGIMGLDSLVSCRDDYASVVSTAVYTRSHIYISTMKPSLLQIFRAQCLIGHCFVTEVSLEKFFYMAVNLGDISLGL